MGQNTPDDDTEHLDRRQFTTKGLSVGAALSGFIWIPDSIDEFLGGPDPLWTVDDPELVIEDDVEDCTVSPSRDGATIVMDIEGRVSRSAIGDTLVIQLKDRSGLIPVKKTREITSETFNHTLQTRKVNDFDYVRVSTRHP